MKKLGSQITVAVVCCILGFMLAYQFKEISKNEKNNMDTSSNADITVEIQQLRKDKQDMQTKLDDLQSKIKDYENSAASSNEANKALLDELTNSRIVSGAVDVKGPGVIIDITPKNDLFGNSTGAAYITPESLANLINYLNSWEAEAISINDIRITSRTGITQSGSLIEIDNDRFSPTKKVEIKAIGDEKKIKTALGFTGVFADFVNCDYEYSTNDNIVITKYTGNFKMDYAKPVGNK